MITDALLCVIIVQKVGYTEIDWIAYMQEVRGFLAGERNYKMLMGDTGPLVYPAGFVCVYSVLNFITSDGTNLRLGDKILFTRKFV